MADCRILGIGGSLHKPSNSLAILKLALEAAQEAGAEIELVETKDLGLPFYQPDYKLEDYAEAQAIGDFLAKVQAADGYLWSSPTYHATPSGIFKNALDFMELLPRKPHLYLTGKAGGLLVVAGGPHAGPNALTSLIHNARALRMMVATGSVQISPARSVLKDGVLIDEHLARQVSELGREVVRLTVMLKS